MKIEVHIIQPLRVNRMNTDREGHPKTIPISGYTRTRISSQALKRAARMYTHEYKLPGDFKTSIPISSRSSRRN